MTLEIAAGGDVIFAAFLLHSPSLFPLSSSSSPSPTPNKKSALSFGPVMFNRLMRLSYCINGASDCLERKEGRSCTREAAHYTTTQAGHMAAGIPSVCLTHSSDNVLPPPHATALTRTHEDGVDDDYDDDDDAAGRTD